MSSLKCPQCNLMNFATAVSCGRCGFLFQEVKRPMPPVRVAGINPNLSTQAGALANVKPSPVAPPSPVNSPNTNLNIKQSLPKNDLPNSAQNLNTQPQIKPPQNQYKQTQIPPVSNQTNGVMSNSVERNAGLADIALEANSTGLLVKILMLPFTVVRKILGFLYSHKKVAALVLAPPALAVVVGPNLLEAIKSANENSAIATIKLINQGQTTFLATKFRCGELKELEQGQLIDSSVAGGKKSGYIFTVSKLPDGCEVYARPTEMEGLAATGNRSFYFSSRDNTLRVSLDKKVFASAASLPVDVNSQKESEKPKIAQAK